MSKLFSFLLFFKILNLMAQDSGKYLDFAFRADSAFGKGNFDLCSKNYAKAFRADSAIKDGNHMMYCASCFALDKKADSAFHYMYQAVKNGWLYFKDTETDPDLEWLRRKYSQRWNLFLKEMSNQIAQYEKGVLWKSERQNLLKALKEDQKWRRKAHQVEGEYGRNSKKMKPIWDSLQIIDEANYQLLIEILDKSKFPLQKEIGVDGLEAFFVLLSHQHDHKDIRKKALVKASAIEKKQPFTTKHLVYLEDQVRQDEGHRQLYGTRFYLQGNKIKFWPVEKLNEVNARRRTAGLRPMEQYAEELKIEMPKEGDKIPTNYELPF